MSPEENTENIKNDNLSPIPPHTKSSVNKLHFIILTEEGAFEGRPISHYLEIETNFLQTYFK